MKIFLAVILIFTANIAPVYGIRPSDGNYSEEKQKMLESVIPAREEREKNLHPFVQAVSEEQGDEFNYAAKKTILMEPEMKTQDIKTREQNAKPNSWINFLFFSLMLAIFLLSHFFIRPRSK